MIESLGDAVDVDTLQRIEIGVAREAKIVQQNDIERELVVQSLVPQPIVSRDVVEIYASCVRLVRRADG